MHSRQGGDELHALLLTAATLLAALGGTCIGLVWALGVPLQPADAAGACLWTFGWTAIGTLQGACTAPAYYLGRGGGPASWCRLIVSAGCVATTLIALSLWSGLGQGGHLSLRMAAGLCVMCAMPLCTYLAGRRELAPGAPVWL